MRLLCFIASEVTNSKSAARAQHLSQRKKYPEHRINTKFYLFYIQSCPGRDKNPG